MTPFQAAIVQAIATVILSMFMVVMFIPLEMLREER